MRADSSKQANVASQQQTPVRRFAKRHAAGGGNPILFSDGLKTLTVVSEDAVFRADPQKPQLVLVKTLDSKVRQPLFQAVGAEAVLLRDAVACEHQHGQEDGRRYRELFYHARS